MNAEQLERPPLAARLTVAVVVLLIGSFVAWAAFAYVDEIARGDGKVIPVSKTQVIQSSEAGVVQEIAVRVGQVISQGDLLLRLDNTGSAASLGESEAEGARCGPRSHGSTSSSPATGRPSRLARRSSPPPRLRPAPTNPPCCSPAAPIWTTAAPCWSSAPCSASWNCRRRRPTSPS
jgi:hypothetical protein